jgi:hypothetical protein
MWLASGRSRAAGRRLLVWLVPAVGLLFDESVQLVELWAKSRPRTTTKIAAKEPQRLVLRLF